MITSEGDFNALFNSIWRIYNEWVKADFADNSSNWTVKRQCNYAFGPVLGLYADKDEHLIRILNDTYSDEDICSVVIPALKRKLSHLIKIPDKDIMTEFKYESCQEELLYLETGEINYWLNRYFISCFKGGSFEIDDKHIRGLCYVMYEFENYKDSITNIYCPNTENLEQLYRGILGKNSELHKYKLIEMTDDCEMLAIDPPRFYDSRINKTFYLSNVNKELLDTFVELRQKNLYEKISLRVSNAIINIFDGKYELQTLSEAVERGMIFSIHNISSISVTKLYSAQYEDCLWIKSNEQDITFEELCEIEDTFKNSIVTQVVHLQYKQDAGNTLITHIDHEFVFYSKDDYEKRKSTYAVKGEEQARLKSFKIDNARIPLTLPVKRSINICDERTNEIVRKNESVPFLIYVLKSYLKHTDLIDEYFINL